LWGHSVVAATIVLIISVTKIAACSLYRVLQHSYKCFKESWIEHVWVQLLSERGE